MFKDYAIGYVFDEYGDYDYKHLFYKTPKNIATFIMQNHEKGNCCITDELDLLICDTFGFFINHAPNQKVAKMIITELLPMQVGDAEVIPLEFEFKDGYMVQKQMIEDGYLSNSGECDA